MAINIIGIGKMKRIWSSKLRFLFTPEKTRWTENHRIRAFDVQEKQNMSSFSIKAIFWAAISIVFALMIGQLN
jgi:hypothetical protein